MEKSKWRGHEIMQKENKVWVYVDSGELVNLHPNRDCGSCGKAPTKQGHDACLGPLPWVKAACCGHGNPKNAYVLFTNGDEVYGSQATRWITELKRKRELLTQGEMMVELKPGETVKQIHPTPLKERVSNMIDSILADTGVSKFTMEFDKDRGAVSFEYQLDAGDGTVNMVLTLVS